MVRRLPRICSNSERWISPPSMRATTAPCLAVPGSYWKLNPRTTMEKNRSRCPNMEAGVCPNSESAIFSTGATRVVENCFPAAWPRSATSSGERAYSSLSISSSGAESCQAKAKGGFSSILREGAVSFALMSSSSPRSMRKSETRRYTVPRQPRASTLMPDPEQDQNPCGRRDHPGANDPPAACGSASNQQDRRRPGGYQIQPGDRFGREGRQEHPMEAEEPDQNGRDDQVERVVEGRRESLAEDRSDGDLHRVRSQRQPARHADPTGRSSRRCLGRRGGAGRLDR